MTTITNNKPRIMIASSSSGSGKTLITAGLIEHLTRKGMDISAFKCGPDYIDPMFCRTIKNVSCENLDTFFFPEEEIRRTVSGCSADVVIIEGVMGIYDGISPGSTKGSCYEIAAITDTPIVFVMNCEKAGRTLISLIKGVLADDEKGLIKGIILNRMSDRYFEKFALALIDEISKIREDVKIIGHIPNDRSLSLESRYLGLVMPDETTDLKEKIGAMADIIEKNCDVTAILRSAKRPCAPAEKECGDEEKKTAPAAARPSRQIRLAVAKDEAFCFYYAENLRLFEQLGVTVEYFSPMHDEHLPDGVSGILLGGGYPELHLETLSLNKGMLSSIKRAIEDGIPSLAECGGFMYLHDVTVSMQNVPYETVGVIDGKCTYTGHLVNFGYVEVKKGPVPELSGLRGHEFHYYDSTDCGSDLVLYKPSSDTAYRSCMAGEDHLWGFAHFYYPSHPGFAEAFVGKMREYGR